LSPDDLADPAEAIIGKVIKEIAIADTKMLMLVLSRRVGEKLVTGDDVTVAIWSVKGNQVRIGIAAPPEVQVRR